MKTKMMVAALLASGVAVFIAPPTAARPREQTAPRVVRYAYRCSPCGVGFGPFGAAHGEGVSFWPRPGEHYLRVQVREASGERVPFEAWQATDSGSRFVGRGCGDGGPFLIEPRGEVAVFPLTGACTLGPHVHSARAVEGTASAAFSVTRGV